MTLVQEYHQRAMDFAEKAEVAKIEGQFEQSKELFRAAFENERKAAEFLKNDLEAEPSRSILYRSAASLAIDCQEFKQAEYLITTAMSGKPPHEIAEELKNLLAQTRVPTPSEKSAVPSVMRRFQPSLVDLLIVAAIVGVLAAVIIPGVLGLKGRGGKEAYEADVKVIQLVVKGFFSDTHAGWMDTNNNDPSGPSAYNSTLFSDNVWGDSTPGNVTEAGHYYPTVIAKVGNHVLMLGNDTDPLNAKNRRIELSALAGGGAAQDPDIQAHAIWMGLIVNEYAPNLVRVGGFDSVSCKRWSVSLLEGENSRYLNEFPKSARYGSLYNGDPGTGKSGTYCWIVGENGVVFGAYKATNGYWYSGYDGVYP